MLLYAWSATPFLMYFSKRIVKDLRKTADAEGVNVQIVILLSLLLVGKFICGCSENAF